MLMLSVGPAGEGEADTAGVPTLPPVDKRKDMGRWREGVRGGCTCGRREGVRGGSSDGGWTDVKARGFEASTTPIDRSNTELFLGFCSAGSSGDVGLGSSIAEGGGRKGNASPNELDDQSSARVGAASRTGSSWCGALLGENCGARTMSSSSPSRMSSRRKSVAVSMTSWHSLTEDDPSSSTMHRLSRPPYAASKSFSSWFTRDSSGTDKHLPTRIICGLRPKGGPVGGVGFITPLTQQLSERGCVRPAVCALLGAGGTPGPNSVRLTSGGRTKGSASAGVSAEDVGDPEEGVAVVRGGKQPLILSAASQRSRYTPARVRYMSSAGVAPRENIASFNSTRASGRRDGSGCTGRACVSV